MKSNYKLFIRKSFYFVLGFVVCVFLLEYALNIITRNINVGEYGVLNKINEGKINTDILISGSSRALKAVNPEIIKIKTGMSCYNIASDGAGLEIQLPKIKWYLNKNRTPKIIVQDVSQFGGNIKKSIYEPFKYLPYLSDDSLYQGILRIDNNFWLHKYVSPSNLIYYNFDFYSKIFQELVKSINKKDNFINGFLPDKSKWSANFELYKNKNPDGIISSISESYKNYIHELIEFCNERDIILVFIILPNYYRLKEIAKNLNDVVSFYKALSKKSNVFFFDYSDSEISKNEIYLYNFTHLNINGALKLSEILSADINNNILINN